MRTVMLCVAVALVLAGCTSAIHMRNPTTGQTATCGPFPTGWALGGLQVAQREQQCISDFQRQGYERVSD